MRKYLYLTVLLTITSCSTYKPVSNFKDVTKYSERTENKEDIKAKLTGELSLESAIEIGLKNNPNFISTKFAITAALARYKQAMSSYYPTISVSHNISRTNFNPHYTRNAISNEYDETARTSAINAEILIYDGSVREMNALAAKHSAKNKKYLNKNAKRILTLVITNTYNNILLAKEHIRIASADYDFNKKMLSESQIKYKAGATSLTETLNFETRVNNANNAVINYKYSFETSKFILAELMGLTDGIIPNDLSFPELQKKNSKILKKIEVYLDIALQNRPDLKANRESFKSSKYSLKSAYGSFYPKISLNTTVSHTNDKDEYDTYSSRVNSTSKSIGVNFSWILFSGFSRLEKLREAKALANQKEYELIEKWLSVVSEVRQAYINYEKNNKQLIIYEKNLKLSRKIRDLVELEYKAGNTSLTRLNEVQKDLITADGNYSSAIINLNNADAQFNAAIGI